MKCGVLSYQHPVPLFVIQLAFEAWGDEVPQHREEILHHQVRKDLQNKTIRSPRFIEQLINKYNEPLMQQNQRHHQVRKHLDNNNCFHSGGVQGQNYKNCYCPNTYQTIHQSILGSAVFFVSC